MPKARAAARQWYHKLPAAAGRRDEAARAIGLAKVLVPLSPMIAAEEAWGLYHARRAADFAVAHYILASVRLQQGRLDEARAADASLAPGAAGYARALVHLGLDETEPALAALGDALEERLDRMLFVPIDPLFDPLRSHPGFRSLVFRLGDGAATAPVSDVDPGRPDIARGRRGTAGEPRRNLRGTAAR